jgi:hypothetical protein
MMGANFDRVSLSLDGARYTLVSDVAQDQTSGKYVRTIQFFDTAPQTINPRPVIEIRLTGDQAIDVELQTPKLNF